MFQSYTWPQPPAAHHTASVPSLVTGIFSWKAESTQRKLFFLCGYGFLRSPWEAWPWQGVWWGMFSLCPKGPCSAMYPLLARPRGCVHLSTSAECSQSAWAEEAWMFIECLRWSRHHTIALVSQKHGFLSSRWDYSCQSTAVASMVVGPLWDPSASGSTTPRAGLGRVSRLDSQGSQVHWLGASGNSSAGHSWLL